MLQRVLTRIPGNAIQIVAAFVVGWVSDATGSRVWTVIGVQALVLISNVILSVWNVPKATILAANYLSYVGGSAQPVVISYGYVTPWYELLDRRSELVPRYHFTSMTRGFGWLCYPLVEGLSLTPYRCI